MANTVRIYLTQTDDTDKVYPVVVCSSALDELEKNGIDTSGFAGLANLYECPVGYSPGVAHLLMLRSDIEKIDDEKDHTLVFELGNNQTILAEGLYVVQAKRVVTGASQDPNALYLLELRDKRWLLSKIGTVNVRYNVREFESTDVEEYRAGTTKDAVPTPYEWEDLFEELWDMCDSDLIGTYDFGGFQDDITSYPENLFYDEVSPWYALCDCVRRVGCEVIYDPRDGTFSIQQMGKYSSTDDTIVDTLVDQGGVYDGGSGPQWNSHCASKTTRYDNDRLIEDGEFFMGAFVLPRAVRVLFPTNFRSSDAYGSRYMITITGSTINLGDWWGTVSPSTVWSTDAYVYDEMMAILESQESGAVLNSTTLETRAEEVATLYYRRLLSGTPCDLVYTGLKDYAPGRHIHSIAWGEIGDGLKTWIRRYVPQAIPPINRPFTVPQTIKAVRLLGVRMSVTMTTTGELPADPDPGVNCKQTIKMHRNGTQITSTVADTLRGHWRLGVLVPGDYDGSWQYTGNTELANDATASDVQTALEGLLGIVSGDVSVTGGPIDTAPIVVEFTGDLAEQPVRLMRVDYGGLGGGFDPVNLLEDGTIACSIVGLAGDTTTKVIVGTILSSYWAVDMKAIANRVGSDWYLTVLGGMWSGTAVTDIDAYDEAGLSPGEGTISVTTISNNIPARNYSSTDVIEDDEVYATPIDGYWNVNRKRCP